VVLAAGDGVLSLGRGEEVAADQFMDLYEEIAGRGPRLWEGEEAYQGMSLVPWWMSW
jgi:hypothetical protein